MDERKLGESKAILKKVNIKVGGFFFRTRKNPFEKKC